MPEKEVVFRSYKKGDETQIVHLLEGVFNGWPHFDLINSSLKHWIWKYKDNILNQTIASVAICDNSLVGCWHTLVSQIKIGEKTVTCGQWVDAAVDPSYRGRGLSSKLRERTNEATVNKGINFNFGVTINPRIYESAFKSGYQRFPHRISHLVRINNINLHLKMMPTEKNLLMKIGFNFLNFANKLSHLSATKRVISDRENCIKKINKFDDRINVFWNNVEDHYLFITNKTKKYLNWRYCDPSGGEYVVKIFEENNNVIGYCVQRISKYNRDYPIGFIVDLLAIEKRNDVINALISDSLHYFEKNNVNIINFIQIKNHPYLKILNNHGFLLASRSSRSEPILYFKASQLENEIKKMNVAKPECIHFQYGDVDWI